MSLLPPIRFVVHERAAAEVADFYEQADRCSLLMPLSNGRVGVTRNGGKLFMGKLQPGMLRMSLPGERSQTIFRTPLQQLEVNIPGDRLRTAFDEAGFLWPPMSPGFAPLTVPNGVIASLAAAFRVAGTINLAQRATYLDGLTQALLACLIESGHFNLPAAMRSSVRALDDVQFALCIDYAEQKLGSKLNLTDWSTHLGMSVSEFSRAFKRRTQQAPYDWFLNRRIDAAKRLLLSANLSLADIAIDTGFCSQSHFTECFHRRVGCSPLRWTSSRVGAEDALKAALAKKTE